MPVTLERFKTKTAATATLSGAITDSATSLVVSAATNFPTAAQFRIRIDNEIIIVEGVSGTTFSSLTRAADGTSAVAHVDGAAVNHLMTAESMTRYVNDFVWQPRHNKLFVWNFDPVLTAANTAPTAGVVYFSKAYVPETVTVANALCHVGVVGSGGSPANFRMGYWTVSGDNLTKEAQTADQQAALATTGTKTFALTAEGGRSLVIPGGPGVFIYIGVFFQTQYSTAAQLGRHGVPTAGVPINAGLVAADGARIGSLSGQTSLPSSPTMSGSMAITGATHFWMALS